MPQIFICYSRQSKDIIKTLTKDIKELGHDVWFDQDLTGGQAWWDKILEKIRKCDIFGFALAPEALSSHACKLELSYASDLCKTILPILLAESVSNNLLPPTLSTIQYVDYRVQDKQTIFALNKAINTLPAPKPLPDPLPKPPEVPISYLNTLKDQIETTKVLSFEEQTAMLLKLEERLGNPDENKDAKSLLEQMRKRVDLYAKVGEKIASLLNTMEGQLRSHESGSKKSKEASAGNFFKWVGYIVVGFISFLIFATLLRSC